MVKFIVFSMVIGALLFIAPELAATNEAIGRRMVPRVSCACFQSRVQVTRPAQLSNRVSRRS